MEVKNWDEINGLEERFYLESLHDDYEGLRLIFKNENNERVLCIRFDSVLSYRNVDEGDLLKSSNSVKGGFHKIDSSQYLRWFHEESYDRWKDKKVIHYAIYTPDDCVDILSIEPPKVRWLS